MTVPAIPVTPTSGVETEVAPAALPPDTSRRGVPWAALAVGVVVTAGIAARFVARSHLWLDEALTVNIARLPLGRMEAALRHDGAPPLYYVLLHLWMRVFGTGDVAVRALSGVFAVATLPALYLAGRRIGGRAAYDKGSKSPANDLSEPL